MSWEVIGASGFLARVEPSRNGAQIVLSIVDNCRGEKFSIYLSPGTATSLAHLLLAAKERGK